MPKVLTYKALYAFQAQEADELSLMAGDLIDVTVVHAGDWGVGVSRRTQKEGSFPWSYVEPLRTPQSPHQLVLVHLPKPAFCQHCTDPIWGSGKQAYKCTACDFCCHKGCKFFVENNSALECVPIPRAQHVHQPAEDMGIAAWTFDDVRLWMTAVRLTEYEQLFADKAVDGRQLQSLNRKSLQSLGVADPEHLDMIEACILELTQSGSRTMEGDFAQRCAAPPSKDLVANVDLMTFVTPGLAKDVQVVKGHEFKVKSFVHSCWCDSCRKYLWGLSRQGFQCSACGYNTHKMCLDVVPQCQPMALAVKKLAPVPAGMQPGSLFGATLESQMSPGNQPPKIVVALIQALEKATTAPGLYVNIPDPARVHAARDTLLQKPDAKSLASQDPNALAFLLRRYFSELLEPLFPTEFCLAVTRACGSVPELDAIIAKLPPVNQAVLAALKGHLGKVVKAQKTAQVVSAAWFNVLLRPSDEDLEKMHGSAQARIQATSNIITKCQCGGVFDVPDDPPPIVPRSKKPSMSTPATPAIVAHQPQSYENITIPPSKPVPAPRPKPPPRPSGSHGNLSVKATTGNLEAYAWYAGPMERGGADAVLQNTPDGTFLVRKSTSHSGFSLSVKYREIRHVVILQSRGKFGFSEPTTFDSLPDLISHFEKISLACYNAELETKLSYPFKTAPKNFLPVPDETGYEEPDEEVYMTNRDALRKSLERQNQDYRHAETYSQRVQELKRKIKAQEAVCTMLREQKKLHESYHANLSDADRDAVMNNFAVLQKRLKDADSEYQTISRELAEETRKEREAEERHNSSSGNVMGGAAAAQDSVNPVPNPESSLYYVGPMDRKEAEKMLENQPNGTYLIRWSSRAKDPYTLSLRFKNDTKHIQICCGTNRQNQQCFGLAEPPPFTSLDDLVEYYKKEKLSTTIDIELLRPIKMPSRK